jgi:hypothetical protein
VVLAVVDFDGDGRFEVRLVTGCCCGKGIGGLCSDERLVGPPPSAYADDRLAELEAARQQMDAAAAAIKELRRDLDEHGVSDGD